MKVVYNKPMKLEIRIHGRGGQGNVVAANLLASAAFADGYFVQAFPSFGAERRGAPVTAFVRLAREPIQRHCQVREPDFLIVQDESLLHDQGMTEGLRAGGGILVNSRKDGELFKLETSCRVVSVAASALARDILGRPIPNTVLIATFATLTQLISQKALVHALEERFTDDALEANRTLLARAADLAPHGAWSIKNAAGH